MNDIYNLSNIRPEKTASDKVAESAFSQDKDKFDSIRSNLAYLKNKYGLEEADALKISLEKGREIEIPIGIFEWKLSPLESLVKFLKENKKFSLSRIARYLNRDDRTIWLTYHNSVIKQKDVLAVNEGRINFPITVFSDRRYSVLESICLFAIQRHSLRIVALAGMMRRNPSSLWTVYKRALAKGGKK